MQRYVGLVPTSLALNMQMNFRYAKSFSTAAAVLCTWPVHAQTYKAVATFKVPVSQARALALDSTSRHLYVAGSSGIAVLNADTGEIVGSIAGIRKATDVLLVPPQDDDESSRASTTGFAANGSGATMFDLASARAGATVQSGDAASLCYDRFTNTVVAVGPDSISSFDAKSGSLIGSAKVHAGSGQIACGTLGHVYVADPDANVVHVLNHKTLRSDGEYPVPNGTRPTGLTLDTKGRRLFVSCENGSLDVIDTDSGFTFIELHSGDGATRGTFAWTPQGAGKWKAGAFFTHADGTLTGIRMMAYINYTLGGEWKIAPRINSIVYDKQSHRLFVLSDAADPQEIIVLGF